MYKKFSVDFAAKSYLEEVFHEEGISFRFSVLVRRWFVGFDRLLQQQFQPHFPGFRSNQHLHADGQWNHGYVHEHRHSDCYDDINRHLNSHAHADFDGNVHSSTRGDLD